MRVPWVSFTAIAALAGLVVANLQMRAAATAPSAAFAPAPIVAGVAPTSLIVPVVGVARDQLNDTWGQARSEGRVHEGIDIFAPLGTPVVAAADGRIVKFFDSVRGGVTIYEIDARGRFIYYYAHLHGRAFALAEGDAVRQGQTIGFVGMSGNAPIPHLHFEVERLGGDRKWWRAEAMNPYPLLMAGVAPLA